jgi:hypothetical protein
MTFLLLFDGAPDPRHRRRQLEDSEKIFPQPAISGETSSNEWALAIADYRQSSSSASADINMY